MRSPNVSTQFRRDAKKHYASLITTEWGEVLHCLTNDIELPKKYRDHALTGNYVGFRDCHVKPDLVLIYRLNGADLDFVRLGTHSELFK